MEDYYLVLLHVFIFQKKLHTNSWEGQTVATGRRDKETDFSELAKIKDIQKPQITIEEVQKKKDVNLSYCWQLLTLSSSFIVAKHKRQGTCPCKPPAAALAAGQTSAEPRDAGSSGTQESSQRAGGAEGGGRVSKCSEEIKNYIEERSGEDPLVKGVPEDKNPFKEKGGCVIA
ncbi:PREDICTED: guanine nucleotide-binding protein G(I)/G(S)/G(O) subunit gamma-11 [Chaetura pelagica]|nr:PREDICTED: guanine nucleotide-binding protein G(I)/G(S)/G(O) subunit gamma-11 [Chaetura pelagica]